MINIIKQITFDEIILFAELGIIWVGSVFIGGSIGWWAFGG